MKTISVFPCFVLVCTIFLLSSCTAYQKAQWSAGGDETAHPMWGNNLQSGGCPHNPNSPNYNGSMSGASMYSMGSEYYTFCPKCGRYVRGRQNHQ